MNRRDFLRTAALAGAGSSLWPAAVWGAPGSDSQVLIPILHTTDLHGHVLPGPDYANTPNLGGLARCVTQLKQWRAEFPHHLLLDIGDLYQGTAVGWQSHGRVMVDCINHLGYDAWVIGNHEFDWGADPLRQAVAASRMPVLSANALIAGQPVNSLQPTRPTTGWENLRGAIIKEVVGFKIAVIGLTTPGLTFWLPDDLLGDFRAVDPVEAMRPLMAELEAQDVDAILLAGHMGLREPGHTADDFANRVNAVCAAYPQLTAFIAGHTHKDIASTTAAGVPYTQANYHGIQVGRLDLVFDRDTRKVISVNPRTVFMGPEIELDPGILSLAHKPLQLADEYLHTVIGRFSRDVVTKNILHPGFPTELERLFATAFSAALEQRGTKVDGVLHGMFWNMGDGPKAGEKTIEHIWRLLPFENYLVTAELTGEQLGVIMEENRAMGESARSLTGSICPDPNRPKHVFRRESGQHVEPRERVTLAMNAYDAQSGGQRLNKLREILAEPSCKRTTTPVQTREALIDFIKAKGEVDPGALPL